MESIYEKIEKSVTEIDNAMFHNQTVTKSAIAAVREMFKDLPDGYDEFNQDEIAYAEKILAKADKIARG